MKELKKIFSMMFFIIGLLFSMIYIFAHLLTDKEASIHAVFLSVTYFSIALYLKD